MCSEMANYPHLMMNNSNINQALSIYISGVFEKDANFDYIKKIFHDLNIGEIKDIYFVKHTNGKNKNAYIVMEQWYNNIVVEHLQEKIKDENLEARVIHNDPEYWILSQTKSITGQMFDLQHQYNMMEYAISEMQTAIKQLFYIINKSNNTNNANIYTNNSCCGATSNAWNPMGQPSK